MYIVPDSKVHVANKGPTWFLSAPGAPHVGPMGIAIRGVIISSNVYLPVLYYQLVACWGHAII